MTNEIADPVAASRPDFRIDTVISRSFSVLFRNILPFGLLAFLFTALSESLALMFTDRWVGEGFVLLLVLSMLINFLSMSLLAATVVYGTVVQLRGGHARAVECLAKGIGLMLPVIAVSFLVGLMITVGVLLFIIPGLILCTMLWVAIPAAVVERPGIVASLKRSAELTKGYRWRVLSLIILFSVVGGIVNRLISEPAVNIWLAGEGVSAMVAAFVAVLAQSVVSAFSSVAVAVGYHDLRIAKEGIDSERIAAIFG